MYEWMYGGKFARDTTVKTYPSDLMKLNVNEGVSVVQKDHERSYILNWQQGSRIRASPRRRAPRQRRPPHPQTLEGSFSAVSTPIFTIQYFFWSSRRDLQNSENTSTLQFLDLKNSVWKIRVFLKKIFEIFAIFFKILQILQEKSNFLMEINGNIWKLTNFAQFQLICRFCTICFN